MIKLNLLPPKEKKEIELADFNYLIVSFGVYLLFILIIFSLLLASTYFCLVIFLKTQSLLIEDKKGNKENQSLVETEENIKQANQQINKVFIKERDLIVWTPIIEELAQIVPNGIYLNSFSSQTDTNRINISGWANKRDTLLLFQESLEKSPYFVEIKSPLSNLIKQEDIDFSFSFSPVK